jgi:flagellar motor protein MotB
MRPLVLLSLAALSTACVSKKKHEALEEDYTQLYDRYEAAVARSAGLRMDRAMLAERMDALRRDNRDLSGFYRDLLADFGKAMEMGQVELVIYPDHAALVLANEFHFDSNEASLSREGKATVDKLADLMRKHPRREFQVQGHTDARPIASGPYEDNWQLGAARAMAVVQLLLADDVDPDQVSAATFAATEPLASNRMETGREQNRRVEIALRPTLDDLPTHEALLWDAARRNATEVGMDRSPARRNR